MDTPLPMLEYEPLARHTSWRIGGPARYYAEAQNVDELRNLLAWAQAQDLPVLLLGNGTNLLVRDTGFAGLALRYRAMGWRIVEQEGDNGLLIVEAGAPMAGTARRLAAMGWGGLEWAEGLPGTVGGAVFGNAGCYGGDIASRLEQATLLVGGKIETWPVERMGYGYRRSILKESGVAERQRPIVLAAELRLVRADPAELAARMAAVAAERKSKTPWGSSCGSVFKNPPGNSAGRLIDEAGLKGARIGGAQISTRHGNYIVNLADASSDDVLRLIELARETVLRESGIELELEVQVV